ncbi:DUF6873 family GME fold protein [Parvimonas parva]|uniref:DUF6873 domain-containing protein n=1 Tax=Parvimonas parva TaxID=2769485 RepID=A0ABS1CA43_9FIRM|nr:hypothetical protein [Parvimonas parva]MBK1468966.1 hypothetical protein [Parvimonas parva]
MLQKVLVSNKASESFFELLNSKNIEYIKSVDNEKFNKNYNDHIDISVLKIDDEIYIEDSVFEYYSEFLKEFRLKRICVSGFKNSEIVLNISKNDKYFFHNEKFTTNEIFEKLSLNRKYIKVNQGYANCSMICFKNHIITSDEGIYKTLKNEKINVEFVTTDGIILNGYKNGFIGGTCGFVSDDTLLFYGDVTKYKDYDIIKYIADEENVKIIFPKDEEFVDLGGIISLWR